MARSAEEIAARIVRGSVVPHLRTMVGEVELGRTVRSITKRFAAAITAARAEAGEEAAKIADEYGDPASADIGALIRAHFTEPKGKGG